MNKVYRVVWNAATGTWAAVQETAKACKKSSRSATVGQATEGASTKVAGKLFALTMLGSAMLLSSQAFANTPPLTRTDANTPVATGDKCGYDAESASVICGDATTTLAKTYSGVSGDGSTHIHKTAKSVVLGIGAKSVEMDAAVGKDADLVAINAGHGESMVIIGTNAQGSQQSSVAVGESAKALNGQTVAIGSNANAVGLSDIMIGKGAGEGNTVTQAKDHNIAIGEGALSKVVSAQNVIALGTNAATGSDLQNSVVIGKNANINAKHVISEAEQAALNKLKEKKNPTEGDLKQIAALEGTKLIFTTSVGDSSQATGHGATSLGASAKAYTSAAIAIGQNASAGASKAGTPDVNADSAIAIGSYSVSNRNSVALGRGATAVAANLANGSRGGGATALGSSSIATGNVSTATGFSAKAVGVSSSAYGASSQALAQSTTAIGNGSIAGVEEVKAADGSITTRAVTGSTAVGATAKATGLNAVAVGLAAESTLRNAVALGAQSTTATPATQENTAKVGNLTYSGFQGEENVVAGDQVSVGTVGQERQIKNVAPGKISADSTDAINGSQLYATNDVLGNVADSVIDLIGGDAAYKPDSTGNNNGTIVAPNIANTGKDNINDAIIAARTEVIGAGLATVTFEDKDGKLTYKVDVAKADAPTVTRGKVTVIPEDQDKVMTAGDIATAITNSEKTAAVVAATGSAITVQPGTEDPQTGVTTYTVDVNVDGTTITNENGVLKANFTDTNTITTVSSGSDNVTVTNVGTEDAPNYEIKVDAVSAEQLEASKTRYYSVNDNGVQRANYNNDGATGINSLAAGTAASATESAATAVGNQATAAARNSVALGNQATANTAWSVAIGNKADATGSSAVAIGNGATTTVGDSVALGAGSKADANGRAVTEATVNGLTFGDFAGSVTHPGKVVSVGAKGEERQIKNVAPGQISNTSTDAINGSQLYATNAKLGNVANTVVENFGGNATLNPDGSITYTNIGNTGKDNIHDAIQAATTKVEEADGIKVVPTTNADGSTTYTVSAKTDGTTTKIDGNGNIAAVTTTFTPSTDGKVGAPVGNGDSLVTANTVADAINNSGWKATSGATGSGVVDGTTEELINPSETVTFQAGDNMVLNQAGNVFTYSLNKDININSVQFNDGPKITNDGDNIKVGDKDGNATKITNVKAGEADTDAVNVSQLEKAQAAATTKVEEADGIKVVPTTNADGSTTYTVSAKTDGTTTKIDGNGNIAAVTTTFTPSTDGKVGAPVGNGDSLVTANTVADAINNSGWKATSGATGSGVVDGTTEELINPSETVTFQAGDNMVLNQAGNVFTYSLNKDININSVQFNDGPKITNDGDNIKVGDKDGNATKITNVKAGEADTDAVNVSQLKAVEATANKGWNLTTNGKADSKSNVKPGDTVDFANTDGNVKIENTGNKVTVNLNKDIDLTKDGSVTIGDTKVNNDGLTIVGGPSVTKSGIDAGDKKITNVADGVISATSKDAVNGSQLYQAVNNINTSIAASKEEVKSADGSVTVTTTQNAKGANVYDLSVNTDGTTIKKNADGSLAVNTTPLTNNADGTVKTPTAPNAIATAGDIANAINNSGFTLTAQGSNGSLVKPGATVDMNNTDGNIVISKSASDNKVTYNLAKDLKVDSVTAGDTVVNNDGITINNGSANGNTVSLTKDGLNNGGNRITNVAPGVNGTDAVNVDQLKGVGQHINNRIDDVADDANAGVSSAMAMAVLPQAYIPGKSMLTGGIGSYNGEGAVAVGFSKLSDNGRWVMKMSGTADTEGNLGGAVGAGFHF